MFEGSGEAAGGEPDEPEEPPEPNEPAASWSPVDYLVGAVRGAHRRRNAAEASEVVAALVAWETALRLEQEEGVRPFDDGGFERSFAQHLGILLQVGSRTAIALLSDASQARRDLPQTWSRFVHGETPWRALAVVVQQVHGLEPSLLPEYDAFAAERCSKLPPAELKRVLHRFREGLDPASAASRVDAASRCRQTTVAPLPDGQGSFTLVGPATDIAAIEDGLTRAAVAAHGHPDETRGLPALKYDIAVDLLLTGLATDASSRSPAEAPSDPVERLAGERVPQRRAVQAQLLVVCPDVTATGGSDSPGTLAGYGPIDAATVRRIVSGAASWTRVSTDPITGGLLDIDPWSRAIPAALKRYLWARDATCRAPGCGRAAGRCDIDHVQRHEHGGPTGPQNLALLCRSHHRIKDDGYWSVQLLLNGDLRWRSRWGTERITHPAMPTASAPPPPPPDVPAPF
jgi:Domain of unknown function (DUF222)/HNH endonuclease